MHGILGVCDRGGRPQILDFRWGHHSKINVYIKASEHWFGQQHVKEMSNIKFGI